MYPHQHGNEENQVDLESRLYAAIQNFLQEDRNSRPLQDHNHGEQPSGDRHSTPSQEHNDGKQPLGDRHSRPLEDHNGGEQPSGDKSPKSGAGK